MQIAPPSRNTRIRSRSCALGITFLLALAGGGFAQENPPDETTMRVGFSSAIFIGINMTDARNSIKALTASLAREYDIPTNRDPLVYENVDEAERILKDHKIGAINMPTCDYWLLRRHVDFDRFLTTIQNGTSVEVYVLLAREGGAITTLADLQGRHLTILTSPAMSLATVWLDVELAKKNLPATAKLLGNITEAAKPAKVVLPVFFGQADACLITRRAYQTMVELNPQVGRQLHIIATSPNYIAALFSFRTDVPAALKEKTARALTRLHSSSNGLQLLTLFHTDAIVECAAADLNPSLALLDEHARLCSEANTALIANLRNPVPQKSP